MGSSGHILKQGGLWAHMPRRELAWLAPGRLWKAHWPRLLWSQTAEQLSSTDWVFSIGLQGSRAEASELAGFLDTLSQVGKAKQLTHTSREPGEGGSTVRARGQGLGTAFPEPDIRKPTFNPCSAQLSSAQPGGNRCHRKVFFLMVCFIFSFVINSGFKDCKITVYVVAHLTHHQALCSHPQRESV